MAEVNATQMRDALAWATNEQPKTEPDEPFPNPFVWFWEAIQGDFNDNRSTKQIVLDAAISMIPLVDQVCDVRDLIANCKKLREDVSDTWAWVALVLTLIGLFPFLGSAVKGVLKVFFTFVRRAGGNMIMKAVDGAMTWVITLLRREAFQRYLKLHKIDNVFGWLATEIRTIHGKINTAELLKAFDKSISVLKGLVAKVELVPSVGPKAKKALETALWVRQKADEKFAEVSRMIDPIFDNIVLRLEREAITTRHGIVNVNNIHYRGSLPEATAVSLMRAPHPRPGFLSAGTKLKWIPADYPTMKPIVDARVADGWPPLQRYNVESFHKLAALEIKGPARLYRIISPNSRAMSDCWVSEKVFNDLQNSPNPREAWRKFLAVWPDWNVNGQFVTYDIKRGESLKVWEGKASSQVKDNLPDRHLEGGWEQILFNVPRGDARNDVMRYYKLKGGKKNILRDNISQDEFNALTAAKRAEYTGIREAIPHPNISGPFETGWGYTDFGGEGFVDKIGLPALPGQISAFAK